MPVLIRRAQHDSIFLLQITLVVTLIALTITAINFACTEAAAQSLQPTTAEETKPSETRELKFGEPIERELSAGKAHSYKVMLTVGQYLRVAVHQKSIDVVVRLFGPDGKQITEADNPTMMQLPELIPLIAELTGEYRLEVRPVNDAAKAGRYEIKMEELRAATTQDQERVLAERAQAEAELIVSVKRTAETLPRALGKYKEVLLLWRKVGDQQREAVVLNRIGVIYSQLGENEQALEFYNQALPLRRAAGDRQGEGTTIHNIGTIYWQLGDSLKALAYYNQALLLRREVGDRHDLAGTLNVIGLAYNDLGKFPEALESYTQSLELWRGLGERRGEANLLGNIGLVHQNLGNWQRALEYYYEALSLGRPLKIPRFEANVLNSIGVVYWQLGENQKALEYYNQALPLRSATGDRNGEIRTLHTIGTAYKSLSDLRKALDYLNRALVLTRAVGDRRSEASALREVGSVYDSLGERQKAIDLYNQALLLQRAVADRLGEAMTLSNLGVSYSSLGKQEESLQYLRQALLLHRAVGHRDGEAATLRHIAQAERDLGRLDEARTRIETALKLVEGARSQFLSQELRTSFSASRQDYYEVYVDLLMRMHRTQPSAGYDAIALQASERARARNLLEILTEARADIRQGVEPVLVERERSLQMQLNAKSERLTRLLGSKHTDDQEVAIRKEVDALLTAYQEVQAEIRAMSPRYAALTQPQPLSLKEIQQLLDDDTLLLEYSLGDERSYVWAVTPTSIKSFELPRRTEIEKVARRTYDLFTARNQRLKFEEPDERRRRIAKADAEYEQIVRVLSQTLLKPLTEQITSKRFLIVGDGILQYIPFAALPVPNPSETRQQTTYVPLGVKYEVVNLPSASTLAVMRKEQSARKLAPQTIAVIADPVFDSNDGRVKRSTSNTSASRQTASAQHKRGTNVSELTRSVKDVISGEAESFFPLPRLPFTRLEAAAAVAHAPAKQYKKAVDFAASRTTALDPALGQYRYIHFATHAILNSRHPELSGIVLSLVNEEGNDQDGFLLAHEVYNLNLPAELVVLSGCKTGLGREVKGEGLIGLTRGFTYAGSARVLVTLWDVNDRSTAELMTHFYKGMLGKQRLSPAAALRQAQLAMWRSPRWRAPYYWAAFTLYGEYR